MLSRYECGSWRNYICYLIAKAFDVFVRALFLYALITPTIVHLLAYAIFRILDTFLYRANNFRDRIIDKFANVLARMGGPHDADNDDQPST